MIDLIAEIGQAHEGSLGIAHSYIDALAKTGITTVKFQTHIAHAESSEYETFRVPFSYEDKTRIDYWKRMEFSLEQWVGLKKHCEDVGLEFMSSPFSIEAVELLEKIEVKRYKIGSGEVNNLLMLDVLSKTKKPIILSSGMSSFTELEKSFQFLKERKVENISILQCTTSYPTQPKQWGLNVISELKERFNCKIGFSDHSGDIFACLAATTLGAEILEFHTVFDKQIFGPDSKSSLTIKQIENLCLGVNQIHKSLSNKIDKSTSDSFSNLKQIFEKSLAFKKNIKKGELITIDHLEAKKPKGYGILASEYKTIINKRVERDLLKGEFINNKDIT